jgi:uncharacterized membrane protein YqjE
MVLAVEIRKSKEFVRYGRRTGTALAMMFAAIALYLLLVVVRAVTSDKQHAHTFWPAIGLLIVLASLACIQGLRIWRRARNPEDGRNAE